LSSSEALIAGLDVVNDTTSSPISSDSVTTYLSAHLAKLNQVVPVSRGAFCVARAGYLIDQESDDLYILGGNHEYSRLVKTKAEDNLPKRVLQLAMHCFESKEHYYSKHNNLLYLSHSGLEALIYFKSSDLLSIDEQKIAETLGCQISIGLENANLFRKLKQTSFNDWLTKLPNRNEFINLISIGKAQILGPQNIALVDLSHFSDVNDGLGQDIGNALLVAVSKRLTNSFGSDVKIGRVTGDVFGLIGDANFVEPYIINDLFRTAFSVGSHSLQVNVHIGLYKVGPSVDAIYQLRCATIALNVAKKAKSGNYAFYIPSMDGETQSKLKIIRNLQQDFKREKLQVWYQPQINLVTREIIGVEALLRWQDDKGAFISPEVFVPLAEYSGLIVDIGKWVLAESVRRLKMLCLLGYENFRMAVNVSVLQFRDSEFVDYVKYILDIHGVPPSLLELEITESVVMDEPEIVIQSLQSLKDFGVSIAIDDFGTGFSSLSYIQKMPLDRLKIDRSFVNDLDNGKNAFIAQAIVNLGLQLGLTTIAEGVEYEEQAEQMLALGTDEAQGYLFGKPMPYAELRKFVLSQNSDKVVQEDT
jgi:diguanylate cyclase (GGDEF)-like protein